jgi:hypothetical protein
MRDITEAKLSKFNMTANKKERLPLNLDSESELSKVHFNAQIEDTKQKAKIS